MARRAVFSHDSNPAIDKPLCRKPHAYCSDLLARGEADELPTGDLWLRPPRDKQHEHVDERGFVAAGTMREAWKITPSAGFFVWQMKKEYDPDVAAH